MTLTGCPQNPVLKFTPSKASHHFKQVAFEEVSQQHRGVQWQRSARWCVDGKFLTSSGGSWCSRWQYWYWWYYWWFRNSGEAVEIGSLSRCRVSYIPAGCLGFLNHQQNFVFWFVFAFSGSFFLLFVNQGKFFRVGSLVVCLEDGCDWVVKVWKQYFGMRGYTSEIYRLEPKNTYWNPIKHYTFSSFQGPIFQVQCRFLFFLRSEEQHHGWTYGVVYWDSQEDKTCRCFL